MKKGAQTSSRKINKGKLLGLSLCFALLVSPLVAVISHYKNNFIEVEAADYSGGSDGFSRGSDGSVTASFKVTNNSLDMRGWLLCLFSSKPAVDSTNKLVNSNDIHPYYESNCSCYFLSSNLSATGDISVTWTAAQYNQKDEWGESTGSAIEGHRLVDFIDNGTDWHIVIGPRHYNTSWGDSGYGKGTYGYWENCDYYLGKMSDLLNKDMSVTVTPVEKTYNGAASSLGIKVKDPSSGYTIKYRTASSGEYNLTTNPEYKNAGTYTTYFQVTSSGYKTYQGSGTVKINKANPTYTPPTAKSSLVYTGNDQALVTAGSSNVLYSIDGTNYSSNVPTGKNAGKYTVYYKVEETTNYKGLDPKTIEVTIAKANPVYTAPEAKTGLVYNGSNLALVSAGSSNILYSLDGTNYSSSVPTGKDANSYTVYYKIEETDNYKGLDPQTIEVTIAKADPIYTAPLAKTGLVYNKDNQALVTAGSSNILYSLDGTNYSSDIPSAKNAGSYTVYYKIEETDNYKPLDVQTIEVTIAKAQAEYINVPSAITGLTYDGNDHALINEGSSTGGTVMYSLDNESYSSTVPTGKNAGTYSVYYKIAESDNYLGVDPQIVVVSIAKADPIYTAPVAKTGLVYNKDNQVLVTAGSSNILYSLDGINYSSSVPSGKDAGTYMVYYKVEETPNYKPLEAKTIEVSIAKAQAEYTIVPTPIDGLYYTGNNQPLVNEGSSTGGTVLYSLDDDSYSDAVPYALSVGSYDVYYMIEGDSNYVGVEPSVITVAISENDKTELNNEIKKANGYLDEISSRFPLVSATLKSAISSAQAVSDNPNQTIGDINEAVLNLLDAFDLAHAQVVDTLIKDIGDVRYLDSCLEDIVEAENAYKELTTPQKGLVKNYATLVAARALYNKLKAVAEVVNAIGEVTYDSECYDRINAAKEAFKTLSEEEQLLIPTIFNDLNSAEDVYNMLHIIADLGDVTYSASFKDKLLRARNAFDALDLNEQHAVYNYQDLVNAEKVYNDVEEVVSLVNDIAEELTYVGTHNPEIDKARHAYNALSDEAKALVPELTVSALTTAEEEYEELKVEHERKEVEDREAGVAIAVNGASGIPDTVAIDISGSNHNDEDFVDSVDQQTIASNIAEDEAISSMCEIGLYEEVEGEMVEISLEDIDEGLTITVHLILPDDVDEENFKVVLLDMDNNVIDMEYTYDSATRTVTVVSNRTGTFAIVATNTHAPAKTNDLPLAIILAIFTIGAIGVCGYFTIKGKKKNG